MQENGLDIGLDIILGDREVQQDAARYGWNQDVLCAVVCDGMGGMEGGELASAIGIRTIFDQMTACRPETFDQAETFLRTAFIEADKKIYALEKEDGNKMYAGSTVVAAVIRGNRFFWGSAGDSCIYFMRDNTIRPLARMHNYNLKLSEMFARGEIDEEERRRQSARGEALISYLGIGSLSLIDSSPKAVTLLPDDVILLCSDGLYKALDMDQIKAIVEESGGCMSIAAKRLVDTAYRLKTRKQDNTTVIAIRYIGG